MNLDSMSHDELMAFHGSIEYGNKRAIARDLFPDMPKGYVTATHKLALYAINKAVARNLRVDGDINTAIAYETICDHIYNSLPQFAKMW